MFFQSFMSSLTFKHLAYTRTENYVLLMENNLQKSHMIRCSL